MLIFVKNKHTLQVGDFKFRCCIGSKGSTVNKKEGDQKTPKGYYAIGNLYFRKDRKKKPKTSLNVLKLKKTWVGVMILGFQKNIINFSKLRKKLNMKN